MKKETKRAVRDAFAKLSFRSQAQNPVMLMVYLSACLTTVLLALALAGISDAPWGYIAAICVVLWATVLFGNFAESLAEGRGKAQADALRSAKRDVEACLIDNAALADAATMEDPSAFLADRGRAVGSATLKRGQVYLVRAGEQVPADGEVIMGAASVDESAITGESAPVVRESGGDRSSITGGTTVLSDWLVARVTAEAGQSFLDKMIAMVESAARKKTPNEQALELLLIALTLLLLFLPGIARPVWVRALVSAAPVLALAASLLGSWLYTPDNALLVKLNDIFTGRLYLANKALSETSLAIAGQGLWDADYIVDNCFANLWIYAGPVASVLLWGAMAALLWRLMKKGAVTESACLVVMLAHGFMENHVIWPCVNVCLWLMPCVLFLLPKERVGDFAPDTGAQQTAF